LPFVAYMPLLKAPSLLETYLSDVVVRETHATRMGAINERYSPDLVVFVTNPQREAPVIEHVLIDVAR